VEVERATFERVKNSQLELEFEHIDKLIEKRNYFKGNPTQLF